MGVGTLAVIMRIKPSLDFFEPHQRLEICRHFDVSTVQRILVVGIDQLGGLMTTMPFFRELRKAFPQAYIVNLVVGLTYPVMKNCPYVDDVWLFDKKASWAMTKTMRQADFDVVFLLSGTFRTALMSWLAAIPNRIGYDVDGTGKLLTVRLHQEFNSRYRVENAYDLLRSIGVSPQNIYRREVWWTDADAELAQQWFNSKNGQRLLAFNAFSTDPKRRWTDDGWIAFLTGVKARNILPIMMVAPNEVDEAKALLAAWGHEDIPVESHSVSQTAAIMQRVDFVVGPESGFVHLGLAANHPHVVAFYNVLPPVATFPIDDEYHQAIILDELVCCPCYLYKRKDQCWNDLKCMKQLSADRVLQAVDRWLEEEKVP
jgi:ADP-heptose:LPS heptosyltransferase